MAARAIVQGEPVRKYGQVIGFASRAIAEGSHVHVHNLQADLFERDYAHASERPPVPPMGERRTFQGYLRPDGRVGTRNYVAVISTVNCSASTSKYIADHFRDDAWKRDYPNVDGVFAITHKGGCAMPLRRPRPPEPGARAGRVREPSQRRRVCASSGSAARSRTRRTWSSRAT